METTETKPTETVKEPEVKIEKVEPVKELTLDELKAELEQAKQHAKNKEEEAARHFKKIQTFEQAEQDKKDAELSELDKEKKARVALEAENKKIKLDLLKQSTASKLGLPEILANRLQGETPEEIEADAKQLLETLPKKTSTASATNPGGDHQVGETDAEKRKRLGI
jgi:rRNA maturation endonuclease Nob1